MQALGYNGEELSFAVGVAAPEAEAKPQFLKQSHAMGRNACYAFLSSTDPGVGSTERRSEGAGGIAKSTVGCMVGCGGGGADGKCRIAETGNFPYSPAFFHTTSSSLPPLLHRFSHFICLLWFVSCGQIPELFLRSEKGSAAEPVCWH